MDKEKKSGFGNYILVALLIVAAFLIGSMWSEKRMLKQGLSTKQPEKSAEAVPTKGTEVLGEQLETTIGNFFVTKDEICLENGKPSIYFFGRNDCPYCAREHPIFEKVAKKFGDKIVFHNNMDKLDADKEVWNKYSSINQGAVPFMILGCKYARVGSYQTNGEQQEEKDLAALICKLTNGEPAAVCAPVKDLTAQVK